MARVGITMRAGFLTRTSSVLHTLRNSRALNMKVDIVTTDKWQLDPDVQKLFEGVNIQRIQKKDKLHVPNILIPSRLQAAITEMIGNYQVASLETDSKELARNLWGKCQPVEDKDIRNKYRDIRKRLLAKEHSDLTELSPEELEAWEKRNKNKLQKILRKYVYNWKHINYDAHRALLYMVARMASDHAALYKVFNEILQREPNFQPTTLFDFGSGVGSTIWAANSIWENTLKEHMCIDVSEDMNTIARLLLQGGNEEGDMCFPGVYFRQFVPALHDHVYDLVVSGFSLLELGTKQDRLTTILNLWKKTKDFLVIVENGSVAGYRTVLEARDFILQLGEGKKSEDIQGYVFSPCPHDNACPRFLREDGKACNFNVNYHDILLNTAPKKKVGRQCQFRYSYVVLRKGERTGITEWPRVIQSATKATKCVHLRMCTAAGRISHSNFTRNKPSRQLYQVAKKAEWGDRLPLIPRIDDEEHFDDQTTSSETIHDHKLMQPCTENNGAVEEEKMRTV